MDAVEKRLTHRARLERLQDMLTHMPQVHCPLREYFTDTMYAREVTIPAGTTVVGAVHKVQNLMTLSAGRVIIATEDGPLELEAPHTRIMEPGCKNAVTTLTQAVWTNYYATTERDPDKLCRLLTEAEPEELLGQPQNLQLVRSGPAPEETP